MEPALPVWLVFRSAIPEIGASQQAKKARPTSATESLSLGRRSIDSKANRPFPSAISLG